MSLPLNKYLPGVWRNIVTSIENVKVGGLGLCQLLKGVMGNGRNIRFWLDIWLGNKTLKEECQTLFKLEKEKRCVVSERYNEQVGLFAGKWKWYKAPITGDELREWDMLMGMLENVKLVNKEDSWLWRGGKQETLTVRGVKEFIGSGRDYSNQTVFQWSKWIPKKCNIFMWRAALNRIPTLTALKTRNCFAGDLTCNLCEDGEETAEHLFCSCIIAMKIWQQISRWTKAMRSGALLARWSHQERRPHPPGSSPLVYVIMLQVETKGTSSDKGR